jgi:spore maturation protein CgeB
MIDAPQKHLRILAVADIWQGSNAYAYVRAFRRMGHSMRVVPPENFFPLWQRKQMRALRRMLEPMLVREYESALIAEAEELRPHLFFVFKGRYVTHDAIRTIRRQGAVAINIYPDVSFLAHGKYLPAALPAYDWIFTTKSFGVRDMERLLGMRQVSFLPHSYDPETHAMVELDADDLVKYGCDVSFIGTWSPKKQSLLEYIRREMPSIRLRIWGAQWEQARATLESSIEGQGVFGCEYAKAMRGSKTNLAILSEARLGASSGDRITSRTFHIPATGAFMLHERTDELLEYFREGAECGCFGDASELVQKITYYLDHEEERQKVATEGRRRSLESGYSVDSRAERVLEKAVELIEAGKSYQWV